MTGATESPPVGPIRLAPSWRGSCDPGPGPGASRVPQTSTGTG